MTGTTPNWIRGYVPPASEWNALWASKLDADGAGSAITATGSTRARTLGDRFSDFINLLDYAVGDGSTDDTAMIQAAVTAARYKTLIVPGGHRFVISSIVTCIGPMTIAGATHGGGPGEVWEPGVPSQNVSEFICATSFTSGDMFYCPSEYPVNFRDLLISSHVSLNFLNITNRGAGAAIHLVGANTTGNTNANSSIERVAFSGFDVDVYLERCADTNITQCYFQAWKTAAIDVGTGGYAVESSPGHIHHNKFFGDVTLSTAQLYAIRTSSGYGGITDNLIVGSQTAIRVNANDLVNIGSMIISRNSMEEQTIYGVDIEQTNPTTIDAIQIDGNEFSNLTNTTIHSHVHVAGATQASIKTLSISGNKFQSFLTGGSGICIEVQCGTTVIIDRNLFNISGCYAVAIGPLILADVFDNKINGTGILGTAGYFFNTPANIVVRDTSTRAIGAASIPGLSDGSSLYIFDGQAAANSSAVTSSGTGCIVWRIGGAWVTIPGARTALDAVPVGQVTPAAGAFTAFASKAPPAAITAATYTVGATDTSLIFNTSATHTVTLPAAASFSGRWLNLKNIAAFAINSATSNIGPVASGTAGTAILAATAGKWALLQSDGTIWQIMAAN